MYNYAFYAYLFYKTFKITSTIESALGFVSFIKTIYKWVNTIKDREDDEELSWVIINYDPKKLKTILN